MCGEAGEEVGDFFQATPMRVMVSGCWGEFGGRVKPCKNVDYDQPSFFRVSETQSRTAERGKV